MDLKKFADDLVLDYLQHFGSDVVDLVKEKTGRNPITLPNSALYQMVSLSLTGSPFPLNAFQKPAERPVPVVRREEDESSREGLLPLPSTMFTGTEASHHAFLTAHGGTTRSTKGLHPSGKELASRKMPSLDGTFVASGNVSGGTVIVVAGDLAQPLVAADIRSTLKTPQNGAVKVGGSEHRNAARLPSTTLMKYRSRVPTKDASQPVGVSPRQSVSAVKQAALPSERGEDVRLGETLNASSTKPPLDSPVSSATVGPSVGITGPFRSTAVTRAARRLPFESSSSEDSDEYENPEVSTRSATHPATSTVKERLFRRIKVASSSDSSPEVDAKAATKGDTQRESPCAFDRPTRDQTATLASPRLRSATMLLVRNVLFQKKEAELADDESSQEDKSKPVTEKFPVTAEVPAFAKTTVGSARKRAHGFADDFMNGKPKIFVTPSPSKSATAQRYFPESAYSLSPNAPIPTPSRIVRRPRMLSARIQTVQSQTRNVRIDAFHTDKTPAKVATSKLQSKSAEENPEPSKNFARKTRPTIPASFPSTPAASAFAMAESPEFHWIEREEESSHEDEQLPQKKALMKPGPPIRPKPASVTEEDEILEAEFNILIEAARETRYAVASGMDLSPISPEEAPWLQQFKKVHLDCMRRYREAKESQLEAIKTMTAHFRARKIVERKLEEAKKQYMAAEKAMETRETCGARWNYNLAQIQLVETADRLEELTDTLHVLEERKEGSAKTQYKALAQLCRVLSKCTELLKPQHATLPLVKNLSRLFELESL